MFVNEIDKTKELKIKKDLNRLLDKVFEKAKENIFIETENITIEGLNDLFRAVEMPPFEDFVITLVVPRDYKEDVIKVVKSHGEIEKSEEVYLWTSKIIFVKRNEEMICAIGNNSEIYNAKDTGKIIGMKLKKQKSI